LEPNTLLPFLVLVSPVFCVKHTLELGVALLYHILRGAPELQIGLMEDVSVRWELMLELARFRVITGP
jgi:hypothetical protein